jgi:hypothetical protein
MILDANNLFSNAQTLTSVGVGTADSTNIVDLGVTRDIGDAVTPHNLFLLIQVVTAFTSGGSATLTFQVQTATDSSGAPGTWTVMYQSPAIAVASLVQGYRPFSGPLPTNSGTNLNPTAYRFLKLTYVVGTAAMTAGALTAGLSPSLESAPSYARGYTA